MTRISRTVRQRAIELEIQRLERRITPLRRLSNRVSWMRVIIFGVGLISALGLAAQVNGLAGTGIFIVALLFFAAVVVYHRHLERWIAMFTIWRDLRLDQVARMTLHWTELPLAKSPAIPFKSLARDLDLTGQRSLHHLVDTTISSQGSQQLAEWLTQANPDPEQVHARQSIIRELLPLSRFRDRFRLALHLVLKEELEGASLLRWLTVKFPSKQIQWTLPVASLFVLINLTLLGLNLVGGLPAYWMISVAWYVVLGLINSMSLNSIFDTLLRLDTEFVKFSAILNYLETFPYQGHARLAQLCAPLCDPHQRPSTIMRQIKFITIAIGLRSNPVLGLVLNLIFPWDCFFAFLMDRYRIQIVQVFPVWLKVCYELDALIALANFGYLNPEYIFPNIIPNAQPVLKVHDLGHPLIPHHQTICNSFTLRAPGELAMITGSNMAGKSTFIKTVGINLCLAYAGAPVHATFFCAAPFRLYTCIHISDSIADGVSYFYAEVKCLKQLLNELKSNRPLPLLYLIDEIFRGTNNRERLLGSRAYIQSLLGENGIGLLATHDLELAHLADSRTQVHNYHFRDRVLEGKLVFDYKIHPGPCPTTNALQIMQMEGLPVDLKD